MWFEDIPLGHKSILGSYTFTEKEIIRFAKKYDPQIFHIDPVAAKDTVFGGLIASGWHTAAIWMKLMVAYRDRQAADMPEMGNKNAVSPGIKDIRWFKPVRPGTTLTYTVTSAAKKDWPSRPNLGLLENLDEARDERGDLYMSFTGLVLLHKKPV